MPVYVDSTRMKRDILLKALSENWETCQEIFKRVGAPFRSDDDVYGFAHVLFRLGKAEKDKNHKPVRFRKAANADSQPC